MIGLNDVHFVFGVPGPFAVNGNGDAIDDDGDGVMNTADVVLFN